MKTRVPAYAFAFGDTLVPPSRLTTATGSGPLSICYGFDSVWVGCTNTGNVERYDMAGNKIATISVGGSPQGICVGAGSVWVTNLLTNNLDRIDPITNTVIASIAVGGTRPTDCCFDGTHVWTSNFNSGSVSKVNAGTNTLTTVYYGVASNPSYRLCFDGTRMWVGDWSGGKLVSIDIATGTQTPVTGITNPWGMFFDGTYLYVSAWLSSRLYVIAPWNGVIVVAISLTAGGGPHDVLSVGDEIWVALSSLNQIQCINRNTFDPIRSINTGADPAGLCFDGSSVWVTNALGPSIMRFQIRERWA